MRTLILTLVGILGLAASAAAQAPVAIVEDLQGKVDGVELMDYVAPGKVIKLGPKATLVLGYLKSCWRETIAGGTVVVGAEQSTVQAGEVQRVKVPCDAAAVLSEREASQGAATTFRTMSPGQQAAPTAPPTVYIYSVSPLIEAKSGGVLVIERVDAPEDKLYLPLNASIRVRGKFYDLAKAGKALTPGGTYAATARSRSVTFVVDSQATAKPTTIVGRLLRLE